MERVEHLLRFALASGIGPVTVHRLLAAFGSADEILGASETELCAVDGVTRRHARAVQEAVTIDPRPELDQAAEQNVRIIAHDDPLYPPTLKEIYDPPYLLYFRGTITPTDSIGVAIVGTRRASRYGREQAERFGGLLARAGFVVVSGLARGIDSFAHKGCLAAGGRTLAVLGSGLSHMYPEENRDLATEIAKNGAVLTEFPMDTRPSRETFPRRNRIIAGLTLGTLVIEAPERSGALITARYASEMGREIFAVPGRVDQDMAAGCHKLLRDGATLTRNLEDILAELGPVPDTLAKRAGFAGPHPVDEASPLDEAPRPEHDGRAATILGAMTGEPIHIDILAETTGLPVHKIISSLTVLELTQQIAHLGGGFYTKK